MYTSLVGVWRKWRPQCAARVQYPGVGEQPAQEQAQPYQGLSWSEPFIPAQSFGQSHSEFQHRGNHRPRGAQRHLQLDPLRDETISIFLLKIED